MFFLLKMPFKFKVSIATGGVVLVVATGGVVLVASRLTLLRVQAEPPLYFTLLILPPHLESSSLAAGDQSGI